MCRASVVWIINALEMLGIRSLFSVSIHRIMWMEHKRRSQTVFGMTNATRNFAQRFPVSSGPAKHSKVGLHSDVISMSVYLVRIHKKSRTLEFMIK